jgi:hypothetical protein
LKGQMAKRPAVGITVPVEESAPTPCCKLCKRKVGAGESIIPFNLDGVDYCPRCFRHRVAPTLGERFYAAKMYAIYCNRCGQESLAIGAKHCHMCNSDASFTTLPPVQ